MEYKKTNFDEDQSGYPKCIPAIGEGARNSWVFDGKYRRHDFIGMLKKKNMSWKTKAKQLNTFSKSYQRKIDCFRLDDLYSIKSSITEICLYSPEEVKWIQKNYRVLKKRIGILNATK